ncbi:hypothetical protein, partial [Methylosinus sp. R-45379]|uniref:hypothetical protein n=1 Tax=Methylosinus sp. R-45379 TaxID=980563 RepID=UPI000B097546
MRLVLRKERAAQGVDNAVAAQSRKALIGKIFAGRRRATIALLLTFVIGGAIAWRIFGAAEAPA